MIDDIEVRAGDRVIVQKSTIVDWNGTYAWTNMWMDGFWWESADFTDPDDRAYYAGLMDWSFVNDIDAGYVHNAANNILGADIFGDSDWDVGLGSLSWAYDDIGYLANGYDDVFFGITPDWLGWNCLYNHDSNHGHWTASAIASQGIYDYEVYDNASTTTVTTTVTVGDYTETTTVTTTEHSYYKLPGVAVGAEIMACKGVSSGGSLMADFWGAGFHLNTTGGPNANETIWEYNADGESHRADIVSNSWGWGPGGSYLQLYYYALMYDVASVPDVLGTGYPGALFVFSAGNNGNDYGTTGTPAGSYSVLTVGASYTSHYYQGLYGPEQTDSQAVAFSGTGPAFTGIVKPDIMAPGYRGVNPQPFHNIWLDAADPYYWWQGTSLSCPVVAGVAAIIIDAYVLEYAIKPTPQVLKNILLSSASDMGLDAFIQGHGLVDALAAVTAVQNNPTNEYYFESESFDNYGDQVAEAWAWWGYDFDPFGIYMPSETPVGMETSSIFFGSVDQGGSYSVNLTATDYAGSSVQTGVFDSYVANQFTEASKFSFVLESGYYNDTNFDPWVVRPTTFNLYDEMGLTNEGLFDAATYATINVAFDADEMVFDTAGNHLGPYVRLFDWNDTIANGDLNYWNFVTETGDIVDHVSRYTDACNLLTIRVANPTGLGNLFDYAPGLQIDDPAGPTNVTVTITLWAPTLDTDIVITDGASSGIGVTLNVDANAEYGVHQGTILFVDGAWSHKVPYSYMVDFNMVSTYAVEQVLVDGVGATSTPYDTGAMSTSFIAGSGDTNDGGGLDVFRVNIPYDITINASVVVIRASWENAGTIIDFNVRNLLNGVEAGTARASATGALNNTIIWDNGALVNGSYWFTVQTRVFDGASVPEDIKITFQLYNATTFAPAVIDNTWTSNTMGTPTIFADGDTIAGDHVVIDNTWTLPAVAGVPEYHVTNSKLALMSGLYVSIDGTYADPAGVDDWPVPVTDTDIYNWEIVEGITAGDNVRIALDAQHNADPSFDVWDWEDADSDGEVDLDEISSTSLLSVDNGGNGAPESGSYTAAVSGDIAIRVYCWEWVFDNQDYTLTVDTRASVDILNEAGQPAYTTFDTYMLFRNITMDVIYTCDTATDVSFENILGTVTFGNFFEPVVTVNDAVEVGTGTDIYNLTWSSTDANADDTAFYSVWLSRDGGTTFVLLQQNTTSTFYLWDSSTWLEATYMVMVRAYSCDLLTYVMEDTYDNGTLYAVYLCDAGDPPAGYWPGDFSDSIGTEFAAGAVPPVTTTTTTTTNTTTTTTTTTAIVAPLDPLLIGLLGGIGVGVVVLLVLFLIKKK